MAGGGGINGQAPNTGDFPVLGFTAPPHSWVVRNDQLIHLIAHQSLSQNAFRTPRVTPVSQGGYMY